MNAAEVHTLAAELRRQPYLEERKAAADVLDAVAPLFDHRQPCPGDHTPEDWELCPYRCDHGHEPIETTIQRLIAIATDVLEGEREGEDTEAYLKRLRSVRA